MSTYLIYGLFILLWLGLAVFFYWRRIWLLYYTVTSVGLALFLIFAGTNLLPVEAWLESSTALSTHIMSARLGLPTQIAADAPGNLQVWSFQTPGWTTVRVNLECSGLLEMAALAGLVFFYPAWSPLRRAWWVLVGWAATFGANVIRLLIITIIVHIWGESSYILAHTIIGRMVFFIIIAGVYWVILTRGTLRVLQKQLAERMLK